MILGRCPGGGAGTVAEHVESDTFAEVRNASLDIVLLEVVDNYMWDHS